MTLSDNFKQKVLSNDPAVAEAYENLKLAHSLGHTIARLRTQQHLTQKELADKVGTCQSAISRLEGMEYLPSLSFLNRIAKALNATLEVEIRPSEQKDTNNVATR